MSEMVADFWGAMLKDSEFDIVPIKLQRFLHREQPPATWTQTMGFYAHGYDGDFERMIMIAIDLFPNADYLTMPTFFLARHAAELNLKNVIIEYSEANGRSISTSEEHNLSALWEETKTQIEAAGWKTDDRWTNHCRKIVQHLSDADPDGQRFRYPQNNAGRPFPYTRVELQALAKAHAHIKLWCEAACDMLDASRE
jgi:hypothetical protein